MPVSVPTADEFTALLARVAALEAKPTPPLVIVPPYLNSKGVFTKKIYEFIPSNAPMGGLDINFNQQPGHAWYPYAWWQPNQDRLSSANFNLDPSDGALVITPGSSGSCTIQSFADIAEGGLGTINGNGFVGTHAFELDWHPNNGSGFWSMSKSHVSDNVTPNPGQPLTLNAEMDWIECVSSGATASEEALRRQLVPTTLHRNTSAGGGIPDTQNEGNMATLATFFATMPNYPNGQPFNAARHTLGGVHLKGEGFWIYVDGVLVNEFTGANYYDSAPQDYGMFLDYSGNYMLPPNNNPDPAQMRLYRLTIYT